ncbi:hypothetical protein EUTSA_v10024107mg [Eutrema salsugineum]|uniref:Uncharacterized protein n=1 Tax=Eutrema salsugineum TaxID=72664 RepID=V4KQN0_EUTSA|nr:hypothetical protein EUTSA_v10024107mg [Eutrema salsugineum]
MLAEDDICRNNWGSSSSYSSKFFTSQQKWEDAAILDYEMCIEPNLQVLDQMKASSRKDNNKFEISCKG